MSSFKFEIEWTGLKIKVEGDRPELQQRVTQEMSRIAAQIEPAVRAAMDPDGVAPQLPERREVIDATTTSQSSDKKSGRRRSTSGRARPSAGGTEEPPVMWSHDPTKYGRPLVAWSTAKKAVWLLHVVAETKGITSMTNQQITSCFNAMFETAGLIRANNVTRDLGRLRQTSKDISVHPDGRWFLTDDGIAKAKAYVAEGLKVGGTVN